MKRQSEEHSMIQHLDSLVDILYWFDTVVGVFLIVTIILSENISIKKRIMLVIASGFLLAFLITTYMNVIQRRRRNDNVDWDVPTIVFPIDPMIFPYTEEVVRRPKLFEGTWKEKNKEEVITIGEDGVIKDIGTIHGKELVTYDNHVVPITIDEKSMIWENPVDGSLCMLFKTKNKIDT
jgi:hypothetical protein